ncbi:MAG: deoxyribose-phosphate aldolase [Bacteroidales bacterium]|jgi:deoxyribose-phosphate aldolase|nr:deoxyribose-phosphate aldolase [Bacteroidales bacterium]
MTQILEKFKFLPDAGEIDKELQSVKKNLAHWINRKNLSDCLGYMDLTSLHSTDTRETVAELAGKVNNFKTSYPDYPYPASVCIYSNLGKTVKETLTAKGVHTTVVSGCFPSSQSFPEVKKLECKMAAADGADEIDIVLALNHFMNNEFDDASKEISDIKAIVGDITLKVILETGALSTPENIATASFLAMESGADFIKTSTGKLEPAATPMAAIVMCKCIKKYYEATGRKIGFKAAGGISTSKDAISYLAIVDTILGKDWLTPSLFRIGASRLARNLLCDLEQSTVNYY